MARVACNTIDVARGRRGAGPAVPGTVNVGVTAFDWHPQGVKSRCAAYLRYAYSDAYYWRTQSLLSMTVALVAAVDTHSNQQAGSPTAASHPDGSNRRGVT